MQLPFPRLNLLVLRVSDLDKATNFYSTLGLRFVRHSHGNGPAHGSAACGDLVFELYPANTSNIVSTSTRVGFSVEDLHALMPKIEAFEGARVITPVHISEWGKRAVVADPDGHRVELVKKPPGESIEE